VVVCVLYAGNFDSQRIAICDCRENGTLHHKPAIITCIGNL
jgi:hypothetical protein